VFRVQNPRLRVKGLKSMVWGSALRMQGLGFRV
jgi:hypothetical protein